MIGMHRTPVVRALARALALAVALVALPTAGRAQSLYFTAAPPDPYFQQNASATVEFTGHFERRGCNEGDWYCDYVDDQPDPATFRMFVNGAQRPATEHGVADLGTTCTGSWADTQHSCSSAWRGTASGPWVTPDVATALEPAVDYSRWTYAYGIGSDPGTTTNSTRWAYRAFTSPRNCQLYRYWYDVPPEGHASRHAWISMAHYVWDDNWGGVCPPPHGIDQVRLTHRVNGVDVTRPNASTSNEWSTNTVPLRPLAPGETRAQNDISADIYYTGTGGAQSAVLRHTAYTAGAACRATIQIDQAPPANTTATTGDFAFSWSAVDPNTGAACAGATFPEVTFTLNGSPQTVERAQGATSARVVGAKLRPFATNAYEIAVVTTDPNPGQVRTPATHASQIYASGPPFGVALDKARSGTARERSQCVTVALVADVAYECGDLRVVHALPSVRTLNKPRTPTLVYSSSHAAPSQVVAFEITMGAAVPETVEAVLSINGAVVDTARWSGPANWTPGTTRRVAMSYNATAMSTGVYPYTVVIAAVSTGTARTEAPAATGEMVVLNRNTSPIGAGWWVAGIERLMHVSNQRLLWIGGDGSTRVYTPVPGLSNTYAAPAIDRPDTLKAYPNSDAALSRYVREAGHGVRVEFNGWGQHVETIGRRGDSTHFRYLDVNTPRWIGVPTASGASVGYRFDYDASGRLRTVVAPPVGTVVRNVVLANTTGFVDSIQDPDGHAVRFERMAEWSWAPMVMKARRDRRGARTRFSYQWARSLATAVTEIENGQEIPTYFKGDDDRVMWRAPGTRPLPPDEAYITMDGPRPDTDVIDVTRFWVNGYGAPTRIVNALADSTLLQRNAAGLPGLVTAMRAPNGLWTHAWYGARGNVDSTKVMNPLGDGRDAVTAYTWDTTWDFVKSVRSPEGNGTEFEYHSGNGNRLWEQPLGDASRRVSYYYHPTLGLVDSVRTPGIAKAEAVTYDAALGNVRTTRSPLGVLTEFFADALGRDTLVFTPIDGTARGRTRTIYDLSDRVKETVTWGPAMVDVPTTLPGAQPPIADSARVVNTYDEEGRLTFVFTHRGARAAGAAPLPTRYEYDAAGRLVFEQNVDAPQSYGYDAAGNRVWWFDGSGDTVRTRYDALNRMEQRVTPGRTYGKRPCQFVLDLDPGYCSYSLPTFGDSVVTIPADTARFAYDTAGNMTRADNRYARVRRSYYPNGLLRDDTLAVRTYYATTAEPGDPTEPPPPPPPDGCGQPDCEHQQSIGLPGDGSISAASAVVSSAGGDPAFAQHVYVLRSEYDRNGRRTALHHLNTGRVSRYAYDPALGHLKRVDDVRGGVHTFGYDLAGRPQTGWHPGGVTAVTGYDDDGQPVSKRVTFPGGRYADTAEYDRRGKVKAASSWLDNATGASLFASADSTWYTGLGAVAASHRVTNGAARSEMFEVDAIGNRIVQHEPGARYDAQDMYGTRRLGYGGGGTRLETIASPERVGYPTPAYTQRYEYEGTGSTQLVVTRRENQGVGGGSASMQLVGEEPSGPSAGDAVVTASPASASVVYTAEASYYGVDGKLRAFNRHVGISAVSDDSDPTNRGVFEEYRYDALGRRVLVRSRREPTCAGGTATTGCQSYVERTVWDGDQIAFEFRAPGADGTSGSMMEGDAGMVEYTHAGGIDQPLVVASSSQPALVPHANWRGSFVFGTRVDNGTLCSEEGGCAVTFPGRTMSVDRRLTVLEGSAPWAGSLLTEKTDGSGLQYMRNRYYDPKTGRFTQADPIGLAGGLNAYGFAEGDPVNFSDPFGLCPIEVDGIPCAVDWGLKGAVGGSAAGAVIGATGGTFVVPGLGTLVGAGGGAVAGGIAGAGAGLVSGAAADIISLARRSGRSLKKEWEGLTGQPWPAGCVAHHKCPLADGGPDDATNIEPLTPDDHTKHHKDNGDFARWGRRAREPKPNEAPEPPQDPE